MALLSIVGKRHKTRRWRKTVSWVIAMNPLIHDDDYQASFDHPNDPNQTPLRAGFHWKLVSREERLQTLEFWGVKTDKKWANHPQRRKDLAPHIMYPQKTKYPSAVALDVALFCKQGNSVWGLWPRISLTLIIVPAKTFSNWSNERSEISDLDGRSVMQWSCFSADGANKYRNANAEN